MGLPVREAGARGYGRNGTAPGLAARTGNLLRNAAFGGGLVDRAYRQPRNRQWGEGLSGSGRRTEGQPGSGRPSVFYDGGRLPRYGGRTEKPPRKVRRRPFGPTDKVVQIVNLKSK